MTQPFQNDIFLSGWMGPSGVECDAPDLIIDGELPADLEGVYFRNGPDPLHPPRDGEQYHWFHGDGMLQRFEFSGGRLSWSNRWVRTRKYELERAAGKSLFGVLGNPLTADPAVANEEYNTANTSIVWHSNRLLALMEGTIAVEIDPNDLSTLGNFDFDGQISGPITAHPKFDPNTGEMVFFGYQALGPGSKEIRYNVADASGNLIRNEIIEAPFPAMVHDFVVTDTHVVFPILPLTFDLERAMQGKLPLAWEPDKGSHFGVMPRNGSAADVKWFNMEARFMFHMMNGWSDGNRIIMDATAANATQFAPMLDGRMASAKDGLEPLFRRWTIDLSDDSAAVSEDMLDDFPCEFPRTDDRYSTQAYRHGFAVGGHNRELAFDHLLHYDVANGTRQTWDGSGDYLLGEPVFAPRTGDQGEADGYLIMLAYNRRSHLSELKIFDALSVEKGPLATAHLPIRIPAGFHGSWVGAS